MVKALIHWIFLVSQQVSAYIGVELIHARGFSGER